MHNVELTDEELRLIDHALCFTGVRGGYKVKADDNTAYELMKRIVHLRGLDSELADAENVVDHFLRTLFS